MNRNNETMSEKKHLESSNPRYGMKPVYIARHRLSHFHYIFISPNYYNTKNYQKLTIYNIKN